VYGEGSRIVCRQPAGIFCVDDVGYVYFIYQAFQRGSGPIFVTSFVQVNRSNPIQSPLPPQLQPPPLHPLPAWSQLNPPTATWRASTLRIAGDMCDHRR
jgi:hypothetical protein